MQSPFLIWQRTLGPRVTINFTFNCQQVLITGVTRALNAGFLLIFLPVGGKKVNRPTVMHIIRPATEISFGAHNLIFITCEYGTEVKKRRISLSFNECGLSQWNSFSAAGFFFPTNAQSVTLKEPSAELLFVVP